MQNSSYSPTQMTSNLSNLNTPNAIIHLSTNNDDVQAIESNHHLRPKTLIFFITGNPGLISYYDEFLRLIAEPYARTNQGKANDVLLHGSNLQTRQVTVAGFSLGGFEVATPLFSSTDVTGLEPLDREDGALSESRPAPSISEEALLYPTGFERKKYGETYSLRDQIELCYARLENLVDLLISTETEQSTASGTCSDLITSDPGVEVILTGHSVGAHIALGMTSLHHTRYFSPSSNPPPRHPTFKIESSILLTPTIANIALSPSGLLATPLLTYIPILPSALQLLSTTLTRVIYSEPWMKWVVSKATGMDVGSAGLETTVQFLRGKSAVRQALRMAGDEMREIQGVWWEGEDIWGIVKREVDEKRSRVVNAAHDADLIASPKSVAGASSKRDGAWMPPRLFLLFAQKDHWVAENTRAEILTALRAERDTESVEKCRDKSYTSPVVVVDENEGLVHAWCLKQSGLVARWVRGWVTQILGGT